MLAMGEWMVICRSFLDSAVWSVLLIHPTPGVYSRNSMSLSFVALERSSDGAPTGTGTPISNQVLANRRSYGKSTIVNANEERFQGVGTL